MKWSSLILIVCVVACSGKEKKSAATGQTAESTGPAAAPAKAEPGQTTAQKGPAASPPPVATKAGSDSPAAPSPPATKAQVPLAYADGPAKNLIALTPMIGPKKSPEEFCKNPDSCLTEPPPEDERIPQEPNFAVTRASAVAAPFLAVSVIVVEEPEFEYTCRLVVQLASGWYMAAEPKDECWHQSSRYNISFKIDELAVRELAFGGSPEVVWRTTEEESMAGMDNDGVSTDVATEKLTACGVGASGKPSCFSLTTSGSWETVRFDENAPGADLAKDVKEGKGSWAVRMAWKDGVMHLTGDAPDKGHGWKDHRGQHPMAGWL